MARQKKGRLVSGILVLDKPSGISSNGALQRVKHAFFAQKAGHTGALDPLATGVLPLCLGEATKYSQYLLDADKCYDCTVMLAQNTDTGDIEGEVVTHFETAALTLSQVTQAVAQFEGDIEQIPPMYSALKRNGRPLYELARAGITVERDKRPITIHEIAVNEFRSGDNAEVDISVSCSKGTYIRVLAEDIGRVLGVGGCVKVLRRTKSGPFDLSQVAQLNEIETLGANKAFDELDAKLLPTDTPLQHFPVVELDDDSAFYIKRGNPVQIPSAPTSGLVRLVINGSEFIGIGEILDDGRVAPRRLVQA